MQNPDLPAWPNDPLSKALALAQHNERVTPLKMPDAYALVQRVHAMFERIGDLTEHESTPNLLPVRILIARARGAWLAAVRLARGGQTVEASPLVRAVIEAAWYALHIARDPVPPGRFTIWLCRDEDSAAEARCATEFAIGNVRRTHETLDTATAAAYHALYKHSIKHGAHPNERAALMALRRREDGERTVFDAVLATDDWKPIALALKNAVDAALGAFKISRLIFWERFAIMGVGGEIDELIGESNGVFGRYAAAARRGSGS